MAAARRARQVREVVADDFDGAVTVRTADAHGFYAPARQWPSNLPIMLPATIDLKPPQVVEALAIILSVFPCEFHPSPLATKR
jgi:hypothetical protein